MGVNLEIPDYMRKGTRSIPDLYKKKVSSDFLYLARDILGYKYDTKKRQGLLGTDPVHKSMLSTLHDYHRFKLMLYFRGSYKTTLMAIKSIQILLDDPNATIMLVTESWNYARKILREIKRHLTRNEKLIELFGTFVPTPTQKRKLGY